MRASFIFIIAAMATCGSWALADDEPAKADPKPETKRVAESDSTDLYTLPEDADIPALLKFIDNVRSFRPKTNAEAVMHQRKSRIALQDAARKILTLDKDKTSDAYLTAKTIELGSEVRSLIAADRDERKEFIGKVSTLLQNGTPGAQQFSLAMQTGSMLESADPELAIEAYQTFGKVFAEGKNKKLAESGRMMEGAARRLDLPGHPLKLNAKTVGGDDFKLAELKGKVVLVDFWATWCGPCIAEIPNMKKLYAKYHDQGFEIVGLSLDGDRDDLDTFLEKRKLPWTILHDDENGGQHPAAADYGIFGIPTMILVGRDGNVLDIHARGESLSDLLEKQFDPNRSTDTESADTKEKGSDK